MSLVLLFTLVDPDVFAVVTARPPLAVELPDSDPLERALLEESVDFEAVDGPTAVCAELPVSVAVPTVPVPFTTASVAFPPTEVVQLPLLLRKSPAPVEVPEPRGLEEVGPVGIR